VETTTVTLFAKNITKKNLSYLLVDGKPLEITLSNIGAGYKPKIVTLETLSSHELTVREHLEHRFVADISYEGEKHRANVIININQDDIKARISYEVKRGITAAKGKMLVFFTFDHNSVLLQLDKLPSEGDVIELTAKNIKHFVKTMYDDVLGLKIRVFERIQDTEWDVKLVFPTFNCQLFGGLNGILED